MIATILIADDEPHILQVLLIKLRNAGYDVMTALDGDEALALAVRRRPDLVITDVQMPHLTGIELCRALAQDASVAAIPVLLLTARGHALEPSDFALPNVRGVVSKPFSPRAVVRQVEYLLGRRREEDRLDDESVAA